MLTIEIGDVFAVKADALIVYADGASAKSIGRIGRKFSEKVGEEEWEYMMSQVGFPIPIGSADITEVTENDPPFKFLIIATTLGHKNEEQNHISNALTALRRAFTLAKSCGCKSVAMVPPIGGGRLKIRDASMIMRETMKSATGLHVWLRVLELDEHDELVRLLKGVQ